MVFSSHSKTQGRSFFDFFPTPKFLEMPAPGLSLHDDGIRMIEFRREKNETLLHRHGELFFKSPRIRAGEIVDREGLISDLKAFRETFDITHVRASLPDEKAYIFSTTVPFVPGEDLRGTVESMIEENVPLSVMESIFDYTIVSQEKKDDSWFAHISVSVLSESVVLDYLQMFKSAGFSPLHFDIESQAIVKAVVPQDHNEVVLIANITETKVGFYIADRGATTFASTTPLSSWEIPSGSTRSLAEEEIIEGIKKIILYWQTQADRKGESVRPFSSCILVGDSALKVSIVDAISSQYHLKTEVGNVWRNAFSFEKHIPEISKDDSLRFAVASGLAITHRTQ